MNGYGMKASWWSSSEYNANGNYSTDRRTIEIGRLDAQTFADILRALARDVERSAGLRFGPPATDIQETV